MIVNILTPPPVAFFIDKAITQSLLELDKQISHLVKKTTLLLFFFFADR